MGTPELPGIRRRIYYITKNQIAQWPKYNRNASTRRTRKKNPLPRGQMA